MTKYDDDDWRQDGKKSRRNVMRNATDNNPSFYTLLIILLKIIFGI